MDEFLSALKKQEELQPEPSYAEQLEKQKEILLKQREVDDLRKLAVEFKACCRQLEAEDRCLLEQANKTKALSIQFDELKIQVQGIIDQNIAFTMDKVRQNCLRNSGQYDRKRQMIVDLKQQLEHYERSYTQMKESKCEVLLKKCQAELEEEKIKMGEIRSEIADIRKGRVDKSKQNWEEKKNNFLEIAKLWNKIKTQEEQTSIVSQNNELIRTRIIQLDNEIEIQKQREEAEKRRRNAELKEQMITPLKIIHASKSSKSFKNPNEFPMLVEKMRAQRSYEEIFKRTDYIDLRGSRKSGHKIESPSVTKKKRIAYFKSSVQKNGTQNKNVIGATSTSNTVSTPQKHLKQTLQKIRTDNNANGEHNEQEKKLIPSPSQERLNTHKDSPDGSTLVIASPPQKDGEQSESIVTINDRSASEEIECGSNGKDAAPADVISLYSTISTLDLEARDDSSELGFDLSPLGSCRDGRNAAGSKGSGSGDLDFDFLSDSPKQGASGRSDQGNDFDFPEANDDGTFDFF
ncbi:structural maintenance of chromosomes protein 2-like [Toxorhynchites rutilus septentrionalis]|uniref:structural maintenance of chromosomes protein 2-like n=1 Tax=Toxorhynchites rutilus septentrionalis TaxID=329112 RepID=UPI002479FE47|nr:structural maintenance of chromosomes protein 2-like [Toxorhynchites rutilus septentrionalis]